jgi:8-oxo-dGTP pyrophosphatase MutT (NUDIX family)
MYIIVHEPSGKLILRSKKALNAFALDKLLIEAAGGMVLNQKGELLMIFRKGLWDMPKGKLDDGESIEECALREVSEETGLTKLKMIRELQTTYHTYPYKGKTALKPSHWYLMHYHGNEKLVPQLEEDITEIKWANKQEAKRLIENAYPSIKEMIKKYYLA